MKRSTTLVAFFSSFMLAVCFIIIGSISEELKTLLNLNNSQIGNMIFILFLSSVFVQVIIGPVIDKLGHKIIAVFGFIVVAAGFFILALGTKYFYAILASILIGAGSTCLNTVANTLLPVVLFDGKDPARASNFGNGIFGIGLILAPVLNSVYTGIFKLNINSTLITLGGLSFLFFIFAIIAKYPKVETGFRITKAFSLLKEKAVIIGAVSLFCYIALESSMNTWIKPFMTEIFSLNKISNPLEKSGIVLGIFGAAMMAGRFITSIFKDITKIGAKIIFFTSIVSIITVIVMIKSSNWIIDSIAVAVLGLAYAPIFPNIVGLTFSNFKPNLYGSIYGIILSIGLFGGTFIPNLIGKLSDKFSVQKSLIVLIFVTLIMLILSFVIKPGKDLK